MAQRLKRLLRLCAVSSSLFLVGAFVAYRAGALGWSVHAESGAVAASPSPTRAARPTFELQLVDDPTLLSSSKSAPITLVPARRTPWDPRARPQVTATKSPKDTTIFGGSKAWVLDPSTPAPRETPAPKE